MAYNYYNPYYSPYLPPSEAVLQQTQINNQPKANASQNSIIWVQGEAGAKAYPIAPNTTVQLWDSEAQIIYLKSADASGMPTMKILDYSIRENATQNNALQKQVDLSGYVTREEFEKRISELKVVNHE